MARDLPSSILIARSLLSRAEGWVWFVEIARKSGGYYRVCDNPEHVTGDGKRWVSCEIGIDLPEESSEGTFGELSITLPNISRLAIAELEAGELQDQVVKVWAELEEDFADFRESFKFEYRITRATASEATVALTCGHPLALDQVPARVFDARVAPVFGTTSGGAVR